MGKKSRLKKLKRIQKKEEIYRVKGVIRKFSDKGSSDPFMARMLMQIANIKDSVFRSKSEKELFDTLYEPVFQNLFEAEYVKDKCISLINSHTQQVSENLNVRFENNHIHVESPIDLDLNLYFKDFFIRGAIALDRLKELTNRCFGISIEFMFAQEKKFESGINKFKTRHPGELFDYFIEMIKDERKQWFETFMDMRNRIEHKGFKLPYVEYLIDSGEIKPLFPTLGQREITDALELIWNNIFCFCEDTIVMMFATKIPANSKFGIMHLPPNLRKPEMPIKYEMQFMPPPEMLKKMNFPNN